MKWNKKNDYYLEFLGDLISFSISKSTVCGKVQYELWRLPYNNATFIYRSENLNNVKAQAIQYYKRQSTSSNSKDAGSTGATTRSELAGANQGALF